MHVQRERNEHAGGRVCARPSKPLLRFTQAGLLKHEMVRLSHVVPPDER
jgi:hypothetical protein